MKNRAGSNYLPFLEYARQKKVPKDGRLKRLCGAITVVMLTIAAAMTAQAEVNVGRPGPLCQDDAHCFNRLHPDIPMAVRADPGERINFRGRVNLGLDAESLRRAPEDVLRMFKDGTAPSHALALIGPVHIEGAHPGDVLAVTIDRIKPGPVGYIYVAPFWGFAAEFLEGEEGDLFSVWHLNEEFAVSEDVPDVKIPNRSIPGVITTLPSKEQLKVILKREKALLEAGGDVWPPNPKAALPAELCGLQGTKREECVSNIPPREFHGGNLDTRYLGEGVTIYLPCNVEGCGLAVGDFHYGQGDGHLSAIEMAADMSVTVQVMRNGPDMPYGPHYEGPVSLIDNTPSKRFYATMGFPLKPKGVVPLHLKYLASPKVAGLENLWMDISLATYNAVAAMVEHIERAYGYNRFQAFTIAGATVDLRISELQDLPNVAVSAVLPLDVIEREPKTYPERDD